MNELQRIWKKTDPGLILVVVQGLLGRTEENGGSNSVRIVCVSTETFSRCNTGSLLPPVSAKAVTYRPVPGARYPLLAKKYPVRLQETFRPFKILFPWLSSATLRIKAWYSIRAHLVNHKVLCIHEALVIAFVGITRHLPTFRVSINRSEDDPRVPSEPRYRIVTVRLLAATDR
jgi:hypothetical protein